MGWVLIPVIWCGDSFVDEGRRAGLLVGLAMAQGTAELAKGNRQRQMVRTIHKTQL